MNKLFATVDQNLAGLQQTNRVILESAPQLDVRLGYLAGLADRASGVSRSVAPILLDAQHMTSTEVQQQLNEQLYSQHLPSDQGYDRLEDILRRRKVRIAIEPEFIGLSFRARPGEPLRGLDADYARAFGQWLGVEVEFVEHSWEQCMSLLSFGRTRNEPPADLMWSALPASPAFEGLAFSEPYSFAPLIMARRTGDTRIRGVADLQGKVLGCGSDPVALQALAELGVCWAGEQGAGKGRIEVGNLVVFSDQKRIHDCLAEGVVDAFVVERPIYQWATSDTQSRWRGKLEILPKPLGDRLWCYSVGVAARAENARLLARVNEFIQQFHGSRVRDEIERRWQGEVLKPNASACQLSGVLGARELAALSLQ
ncbi:substrate-binding periplasmic protein [Pseudomonas sp.]|uniref:substrate-binding periplasmic protein n=1 Tax=Pseudomonas sp. TaxID=306 RepID=UPI003982B7AE